MSSEGSVTFYATATGPTCGVYTDSATYNYDTLAPSVTSTVPANSATGIAKDSSVTINFSENIDCATVTTSSVTMIPAPGGWSRTSCSGSTAVFAPTGQVNSPPYTVTVDAADLAGNNMAGSYIFTYTTDCTDSIASSISFDGGPYTPSGDFAGADMVNPVDLTNLQYQITETTPSTAITTGHGETSDCDSTTYTTGDIVYVDYNNPAVGNGTLDTIKVTAGSNGTLVFFTASCTALANPTCTVVDFTGEETVVAGLNTIPVNLTINDGNYLGFAAQGSRPSVCRDSTVPYGNAAQFDVIGTVPSVGLGYVLGASGEANALQLYGSGATSGGGEVIRYAWNSDLQLAMSGEAPATAALDDPITAGNTYKIYARGDDAECGVNTYYVGGGASPGTGQPFTWTSCVDSPASTITVAGGPVGGSVDVNSLFTSTQNVATFFYRIDGGALTPVGTAWDSTSVVGSDIAPVNVTVYVEGTDPDCGGQLISHSATISVDNTCTDPDPSTITVPASQSVNGNSVDLTTLFNTTGDVAGFTYRMNGGAVTTPWDSTGFGAGGPEVVSFEVTGTDPDCGGSTIGPITENITVNNANPTGIITITATAGDSKIDLSASYSGDVNTSNSLLIEWDACGGVCDGTTFPGGNDITLANAASPYLQTIGSLTNMLKYQVRVSFVDGDGVIGSNPVTFIDLVPTNPMLHNSSTTSSSYQGGSWGLPGTTYGEFTCETCHVDSLAGEVTDNVKRMRETITITGGPSATGAALFLDARDSNYWGDNSDSHTASDRVCEVCHSETTIHRYDTTLQPGFGTHNNDGKACIVCHAHDTGFAAAGCDSCHGYAPESNVSGPPGLANAPATGSVTEGAHVRHINDVTGPQYTCDACHGVGSGGGGGAAHMSGAIAIDFNAFGSTDGTYAGQTAVDLLAGYTGASTTTSDNSLTCAAVYCHGGTISGTPPTWTGSVQCGSCHNADPAAGGWLGNHSVHLNTVGVTCTDCHGGGYTEDDGTGTAGATPADHLGGTVTINMSAVDGSASYSKGASVITQGLPGDAAYGTCSVSCHGSGNPTWGGNLGVYPAKCVACHNDGGGSTLRDAVPGATSTVHQTHSDNTSYVANNCDNCHGNNASLGTHANHTNDGVLGDGDATFANDLTGYSTTNKDCTNSCHIATTNNLWVAAPPALACTDCHTTSYIADDKGAMPTTGLHGATASTQIHNQTIDTNGCSECHETEAGTHIDGTFVADASNNNDRFVNRNSGGVVLNWSDGAANTGTCNGSLTGCHSDTGVWERLWSTAANSDLATASVGDVRCDVCHGQWTKWRPGTTHSLANLDSVDDAANTRGAGHDGTPDCTICHDFGGVPNKHNTATHRITMNSDAGGTPTLYARTGNTHGTDGAGCGDCHAGEDVIATDNGHNFPVSIFLSETVDGVTVPMPACGSCHGETGVDASAPQVKPGTSAHLLVPGQAGDQPCESCHAGHASGTTGANDVEISTAPATFNNKYATHSNAIQLGGTATNVAAWYATPAAPTEAEMCWGCHELPATDISEWGTNTGGTYNYGNVDDNDLNWTTTYWTSAGFSYKNGELKDKPTAATPTGDGNNNGSIHATAGSTASSPLTADDSLANVSCSACHDVHDTGTVNGKPYLRGTWRPSPYPEDGAPRAGDTAYSGTVNFGAVPRGAIQNNAGAWQIDQNNSNPNSTYTYADDGLCGTCHSQSDLEADFPLHRNSVRGFTNDGSTRANIFKMGSTGHGGTTGNTAFGENDAPNMGYYNSSSCGGKMYGLRDDEGTWSEIKIYARANCDGNNETRYAYDKFHWTGGTLNDANAVDSDFHSFSCSKCHNPHASRLPRLMITNCLDVARNTWDDTINPAGDSNWWSNAGGGNPAGVDQIAYISSAQNCHRKTTSANEPGWNSVTPW